MSLSASDVTIITVNWNGRAHLEDLMPSLVSQGAGEIIVVDNGSTDDSIPFLEQNYPAVKILKNPTNKGFAQPNNLAAKTATGKILALINNDMKAHPDWITAGLHRLRDSDCAASRILSWDGSRIDFNGSSLQYLGYALQEDTGKLLSEITGSRQEILFPCGGAMLIPKEIFLEAGGFDEDFFAIFEDVDLGWRLWLMGFRITLASDSIVYHKGHATFQTRNNAKMRYLMHRNALMTVLKNYDDAKVSRIFPMALMMAVRRAVRCSGVKKESFYIWEDALQDLESGSEDLQALRLDAFNHLVALDDAIAMLPGILEKRRGIQGRRAKSDEQIFSLFRDPLRPIVEDSGYIEKEAQLLEMLGLGNLFDVDAYRAKAQIYHSSREEAVERSRRELLALQWLGGYSLLHPPENINRPGSRIRKFMDTSRVNGFRSAVRLSWKSITKKKNN